MKSEAQTGVDPRAILLRKRQGGRSGIHDDIVGDVAEVSFGSTRALPLVLELDKFGLADADAGRLAVFAFLTKAALESIAPKRLIALQDRKWRNNHRLPSSYGDDAVLGTILWMNLGSIGVTTRVGGRDVSEVSRDDLLAFAARDLNRVLVLGGGIGRSYTLKGCII